MNARRFIGSLLATALAATTLGFVGTASPAAAATPVKIISGTSGKPWIYPSSTYRTQPGAMKYKDTLSISVNVTASGVPTVYAGTVKVQRQVPGKSWKTVASAGDAYLYDSIKAVGNAKYRVVYSGGSNYQGTFDATTSASKSIKVQRKIEYKNVGNRKVILSGKVAPKYKGKVSIFKKKGKKWKKFKTVRSNKKGKFRSPLPAPRNGKYFWNIKIGGSKKFAPSQTGKFYTYSY